MNMKLVPFGFSYRLQYVPAGKRKTVSKEIAGHAMAAIEEISVEDAPVVITVDDKVQFGKDRSFSIRACGNDLLWPVLDHFGRTFMTEGIFLQALVEGTAWPEPDGSSSESLTQRQLPTETGLAIRRRDHSNEDLQVAVVQRRMAQLRICAGHVWIVGVEPVYHQREDRYFRLVKPPSPTAMYTARAPIWEMTDLAYIGTAFGNFFSLDEIHLAETKINKHQRSWPYAKVKVWRVRTDPIRLQLRSILDTLLSTYKLRAIAELSPDVLKAILWMERLRDDGVLPTVEEGAATMAMLGHFCEHAPEAQARTDGARHFIRNMMKTVEDCLAIRGRPSPFPLTDEDEDALASLAS